MPIHVECLTTYGRTVYYPYLGYMNPQYWQRGFISPTEIDRLVGEHISRLRLLCLYWHYILIPFGHIVTFPESWTISMINKLLSHHDFRSLSDSGVIYAGTWEERTKDSVLCEHEEFLHYIGWPLLISFDGSALAGLKSMELALRNVTEQSRGLKEEMLNYLKWFDSEYLANIVRATKDIVLRAEYPNKVPFVHEKFIVLLRRSSIPREFIDQILRIANHFYFIAGEKGNPGVIVPYVKGAEGGGISRRSITTGLYSLVYSDMVFERFLSIFLEDIEIGKLKYLLPIENILKLRNSEWEVFNDAYHHLLKDISNLIGNVNVDAVTREMIETAIKDILKVIKDDYIRGALRLIESILYLILSYVFKSPPQPQQSYYSDIIFRLFKDKIRNFILKFQHKVFVNFIEELRKEINCCC